MIWSFHGDDILLSFLGWSAISAELLSTVSETFSLSIMRGWCDGCCGHTYCRLCSRLSQWYMLRQPRCNTETLNNNVMLNELIAWEGLIIYWNSSSRKSGKYSFFTDVRWKVMRKYQSAEIYEVHCRLHQWKFLLCADSGKAISVSLSLHSEL